MLLCKGWIGKKWHKTKRFIRKHKKKIIIATVVVVTTTAMLIATAGTAAPALAGTAATAGAAAVRPRVNKPGEVHIQDNNEESSPHKDDPPPLTYIPIKEPTSPQIIPIRESPKEQTNIIKETLAEQIPPEPLNVPSKEEQSFWNKTSEATMDTFSMLAHESFNEISDFF